MKPLPILVDGNAFAHRWFHRWAYMTGVEGSAPKISETAETTSRGRQKTRTAKRKGPKMDASSIDAVLIDPEAALQAAKLAASKRTQAVQNVRPERFAVNNARSLIALANSFTLDQVQRATLPPLCETYAELGDTRRNQMVICFDHGDGGRSKVFTEYKKLRKERVKHDALKHFFSEPGAVYRGQPPGSVFVLGRDNDGAAGTGAFWQDGINLTSLKVNAEADDMLAALSAALANRRVPHMIMTHDVDIMHCVRDDVPCALYDPSTKAILNEAAVTRRVGVPPSQIQAFKVLCGDKSDEIPGVAKIGKKRAISLLQQFHGSLDDVVRRGPTEASTTAMRNALANAGPQVEMCKKLVYPAPCEVIVPHVLKFLNIPV